MDETPPLRDRLPDGTEVVIRPLRPDDAPAVLEGFAHLSFETRHRRFLAGLPRLPPQHVYAITHADGRDHLVWAIGAVRDGHETGIGLAHVIRDPARPTTGEFAIVIADEWQGRGAGKLLTRALAKRSWELGVRRWTATMFLDNHAVQALLASVGDEISREVQGCGVGEIVYALRAPAEDRR